MEELLLTTKPPIPQPPAASTKGNKKPPGPPPYDRTLYYSYARDRSATFAKLYSALFAVAKTGQSRNIDMEVRFNISPPLRPLCLFDDSQIAKAFWSVLLAPLYPIMTEVVEYITVCSHAHDLVHVKLTVWTGEGDLQSG